MTVINLEREKQLADLYRQVQKMQKWADEDTYGYSKEKKLLLDKIYNMRLDCLEADVATELEKLEQFNDQANLLWSSIPRRFN